MQDSYITRNGRHVPEAATDQAGSEMLIRTVSRYTDGTPIDRPQLCVSVTFAGGDAAARKIAENLDRRGYLPPERPMARAEYAALARQDPVIWSVLGEGLPIPLALRRHGRSANGRSKIRQTIKQMGWGDADEPGA